MASLVASHFNRGSFKGGISAPASRLETEMQPGVLGASYGDLHSRSFDCDNDDTTLKSLAPASMIPLVERGSIVQITEPAPGVRVNALDRRDR
jgi:hypothetical protein